MSKITEIIGKSTNETVTDAIAIILADELSNQKTINQTALTAELAKPIIDQDSQLIDLLNANIESIPDRVYLERNRDLHPKECPVLNIIFNGRDEMMTNDTTFMGESTFIIEAFANSRDHGNVAGDVLASAKLKRLMAITRTIIMDPNYKRLGLTSMTNGKYDIPFGYRYISEEKYVNEKIGAEDAYSYSYGSLELKVKLSESSFAYSGTPWERTDTIVKINDTDNGYAWTHINGLRGDEILVIGGELLTLDTKYLTIG